MFHVQFSIGKAAPEKTEDESILAWFRSVINLAIRTYEAIGEREDRAAQAKSEQEKVAVHKELAAEVLKLRNDVELMQLHVKEFLKDQAGS